MPFMSDTTEELRVLNAKEQQIILLVALGEFFTCFNFVVYFSFNDAIVHAFFPKDLDDELKQLGFLALVFIGYVSRPLGGMIFADSADRFGRKKVMLYSLATVALMTLVIGLLPTYQMIGSWAVLLLVVVRLLQGVGIGAEVPISWVYVIEQVPRWHIGWASSLIITSLILPVLFANLISATLSEMLTVDEMMQFGWRIPLILGAICSFITILLRYRLVETPIWKNAKQKGEILTTLPIKRVFKKYRYGFVITFLLSWFTSSVYLIVFLLLPDIAVQYFDVDSSEIAIANNVAILFASLGALVFGYCADRFNLGRVFGTGCICLGISSFLFFYHLGKDSDFLLLYYVIFGFFSGVIGMVPSVCVRLFHVKVRCSGLTLGYNLAYAITGASLPFFLTLISPQLALAPALYLVFVCVCGILLSILLANLNGLYRVEKIQNIN